MAATSVKPTNVELHSQTSFVASFNDLRWNATVHFAINSDLGDFQIAVSVEDAVNLEWAIQQGRERIAEWAKSVARNALATP
jgi:hypothetical protein